ncbi:glycosyltransferase family 4 protein [Buchananella felis]|uniref:glycosyltransferase family 4 protein n=1 Tax=Buchananella felis TaxID=3231492 RepID=UPI00352975AA
MKIGIVCPYSFASPGGVQAHVLDLARELMRRGHAVSVLAPLDGAKAPDWVVDAGRTVAWSYNGSVARLNMGPRALRGVRRWLRRGDFDVVHVHEPITPSIGLLTLLNARCPVVATFHTAMSRSIARRLVAGLANLAMRKLAARIAVSAEAKRTLVRYHGGDAQVIPNGVVVADFATAAPVEAWQEGPDSPVIVFLGRLDEPRKGLPVLAGAVGGVLERHPGARFLIAGRGQASQARAVLAGFGSSVEFLGGVSDAEKNSLLKGATIYVAPQLGGESFGIVLVEAMAAGAYVLASNIPAFRVVLAQGECGGLFPVGDSAALTEAICAALDDAAARRTVAQAGALAATQYDWGRVTDRIEAVYQAALDTSAPQKRTDGRA